MFLSALIFAVALIAAFCSGASGKGVAKGKFDYNGVQCKWIEQRTTRSMRFLAIQCGGNNPFSTSYEGDPHKCSWYKDNKQVQYYECLISALKKAKFCKNSPSEIACDKKNCGDVKFKKVGSRSYNIIMKTLAFSEEVIEENFESTEDPDWSEDLSKEDPEWNEFDLISDLY